jgi:hypothetical protein
LKCQSQQVYPRRRRFRSGIVGFGDGHAFQVCLVNLVKGRCHQVDEVFPPDILRGLQYIRIGTGQYQRVYRAVKVKMVLVLSRPGSKYFSKP